MSTPVVVIGAGGYARTVIDVLRLRGIEVRGCVGAGASAPQDHALPAAYLGDDETVLSMPRDAVVLVNAIGSIGPATARRVVFERFRQAGFRFAQVVHPSAVVALDVCLGEGVHVHANAVVQPGVSIGMDSIVDYNVGVGHDSRLGAHVHLAPGSMLSGSVQVDDCAHVGTGAVVIQSMVIGAGAMVGAGAVVVEPVAAGDVVVGVPARSRAG